MSRLISISGLDGSGKSTQIELLKDYLKEQGKTFYYFHTESFSVASLYKKIPLFSWKKTKEKISSNKSITKANWIEIQLRKIALLIDIFRFNRLVKKTEIDYIISGRYFYDSVVNINFLSGNTKKLFAEKYILKPNFAFYLKVDPEKIMQRERKPDQGIQYLVKKEKLYEERVKMWNMAIIDGSDSKESILNHIINMVLQKG